MKGMPTRSHRESRSPAPETQAEQQYQCFRHFSDPAFICAASSSLLCCLPRYRSSDQCLLIPLLLSPKVVSQLCFIVSQIHLSTTLDCFHRRVPKRVCSPLPISEMAPSTDEQSSRPESNHVCCTTEIPDNPAIEKEAGNQNLPPTAQFVPDLPPIFHYSRPIPSLQQLPRKIKKMSRHDLTRGITALKLDTPPPTPLEKSGTPFLDATTMRHLEMCKSTNGTLDDHDGGGNLPPDLEATPIFSSKVKTAVSSSKSTRHLGFPAYGLLGLRISSSSSSQNSPHNPAAFTFGTTSKPEDNLVYANLQPPFSTFICGQQGAGKSHTLSCLLENALLGTNEMGPNPNPMAGLVFHYDKFTSSTATQVCEAAYLCSQGIPVQVLVSPASLTTMKELYLNLPNLPPDCPRPVVMPLLFEESQLNVANMKNLMGVDNDCKNPPLYMGVVNKVLKDLAVEAKSASGVKYGQMKAKVKNQGLTPAQLGFLEMRFNLIDWFLRQTAPQKVKNDAGDIDFSAGTVLIVDLSCPFVTESDACSLFSIFLQVFLSQRGQRPLIIALDEAHKVSTRSPSISYGNSPPYHI